MITTLTIHGITCNGCVASIKNTLIQLGITDSQIDLNTGQAIITHDDAISRADIVEAIEDAGFDVV